MAKPASNDQSRIAILIVAIVAILGYVVFTLTRGRGGSAAAPAVAESAPSVPPSTKTVRAANETPIVSIYDAGVNPFRLTVQLLGAEDRRGSSPVERGSVRASESGVKGDFTEGNDPFAPGAEHIPVVRLSGVIVDSRPWAIVQRENRSDVVGIGGEVTAGFRITQITSDGIRIAKEGKTFWISVGHGFNGIEVVTGKPVPGSAAAPGSGLLPRVG